MAADQAYAIGAERTAYTWTDKAFDLMAEGKLTVTLGRDGNVVASGECPRCTHDANYTHLETIVLPQGPVGTLTRATGRSGTLDATPDPAVGPGADTQVRYVTVPVQCHCTQPHEGRPTDELGCGITFNTELLAP